mgnify:CR=1 FL=1
MDGAGTFLFAGAFFGFFVGVFVAVGVEESKSDSPTNIVKSAIEVCEQTLPRTQHCVITAVPEK